MPSPRQAKRLRTARGRWEVSHEALRALWHGRDASAELRSLVQTEGSLLRLMLPQLVSYLLAASVDAGLRGPRDGAASALERLLLEMCSRDARFALELHWLLLAQPPQTAAVAAPRDAPAAGGARGAYFAGEGSEGASDTAHQTTEMVPVAPTDPAADGRPPPDAGRAAYCAWLGQRISEGAQQQQEWRRPPQQQLPQRRHQQ